MAQHIIFDILALIITVFSIMAVTSKKLIRSATYLLFVLLASAGLYLMLDYHYLFAVQIAVYAGGIMVLFIFAILLTQKPGEEVKTEPLKQRLISVILSGGGIVFCGFIIYKNFHRVISYVVQPEMKVQDIGTTLMGTGKFEYLMPFEAISVLLLACIVGAIMIARKRG